MTENRTMTDATTTTLEKALTIARDNGHSLADPIHLAVALFDADDSIGARVIAKSSSSAVHLHLHLLDLTVLSSWWTYDKFGRRFNEQF